MIAESSQITEILTVVASVTKFAGAAVGAGGGMWLVARTVLNFQTGVVGPQQDQLEHQRAQIDELHTEVEENRVTIRALNADIDRLSADHRRCEGDYAHVIAVLADNGIAVPDPPSTRRPPPKT